jgi:hypothetical protein
MSARYATAALRRPRRKISKTAAEPTPEPRPAPADALTSSTSSERTHTNGTKRTPQDEKNCKISGDEVLKEVVNALVKLRYKRGVFPTTHVTRALKKRPVKDF